jgi:hypothetical protein
MYGSAQNFPKGGPMIQAKYFKPRDSCRVEWQ